MRRTMMLSFLLCASCAPCAMAQSIPVARPQSPRLALPGPQKHTPPSQPAPPPGTVEGFVYWDTASVSHTPASSCSGLEVNVAVGNSTQGKSTAYQPLATLSNNFKYAGQVKQFLAGGKIKTYEVCTYGYGKLPVGPDLRVTVLAQTASPTQSGPFSPMSVPQKDPVGPITIINGQCNMLPRIVNPTASDLFSHWGSCQNMAYDVNFMMQPATQALNSRPIGASSETRVQTGMLNNRPQQGMLASGSSALLQSTGGTPQLNREPDSSGITDGTRQIYTGTTHQNQTVNGSARNAAGTSASLNPQPLPPHQALTNADVIKLVKARTPESVIVHTIESASKQFDFSREGLQALQQAHVSPAVLAAMCDGSARNCAEITGSGAVNGSGFTDPNRRSITDITNHGASSGASSSTGGNTKRGSSSRNTLKPIKLAPPKALEKVTNPRLSQQNASIIAVLEQQRQAAQQEAAAMKQGGPSAASVSSARTAALSANFHANAPVSGLAPGQTQSATGVPSIATLPFFNSLPITCTHDPTPRVLRVSGGQAPTIFTPEAKYNQYTIVGCGFGQSQQGNSAYIFGPNGFKANLNVDFWSDNGISAHFDPSLAGVLDQKNVTLVVSPAGQQQIQRQGFTFYAARGMPNSDGTDQDVVLPYDSMARPSVTTFDVNNFFDGFDQLPSNATSTFPSFSFKGTPVAGWVFRYLYGHADRIAALRAHDCFINDVGFDGKACTRPDFQNLPRNDVWDFNKMAPGFAISGYSLYYDNIDPSTLCGGLIDLNSDGSLIGEWKFDLNQQNQIVVTWPVYDCFFAEFGTRDSFADLSSYGLAVWVLGPRCVDPWTGQKDQSCMVKLKQILG